MKRLLCAALFAMSAAPLWSQGCVLAVSMNLEEMVARSETIFTGRCVSAEARHTQIGGGNVPITVYTFAVDDAIRGATSRTVTFRQFGHPPTSTGRAIAGLAQFLPGEQYLVLLAAPGSPQGLTTSVGLDQGAFRRVRDQGGRAAYVNGRDNAGLMAGLSPTARAQLASLNQGASPAEELLATVRALEAATQP